MTTDISLDGPFFHKLARLVGFSDWSRFLDLQEFLTKAMSDPHGMDSLSTVFSP